MEVPKKSQVERTATLSDSEKHYSAKLKTYTSKYWYLHAKLINFGRQLRNNLQVHWLEDPPYRTGLLELQKNRKEKKRR